MESLVDVLRTFTINSKEIGINLLVAIFLILIGIIFGKLIKLVLKRLSRKLKLDKIFKFGSIELFLTIVKWTVYVFFFAIAIEQLSIPLLNTSFLNALSIIPKSLGSLIIIILGFSLGNFLRKTISQTNQKEWGVLGEIIFLFFVYVSFIISAQLLFVSNDYLQEWIIIILTGFFFLFVSLKYALFKK